MNLLSSLPLFASVQSFFIGFLHKETKLTKRAEKIANRKERAQREKAKLHSPQCDLCVLGG
jgi:hypothetical protein